MIHTTKPVLYKPSHKRPRSESVEDKDPKNDDSDDEHEDPAVTLMKERELVNMEDNHIYFRTGVSEKSVAKLIKIINQMNRDYTTLQASMPIVKLEPVPVFLHITSTGGNCMMGYLAADIIKASKIPIYTIVEGYAFSAGTHMSVVGKKRYITENSVMLIHQLSAYSGGTYEHLKDETLNHDLLMSRMVKLYMGNTNGKLEMAELKKLLAKDIYLDAETCIELGLADEVYRGEHNVKA